MRVFVTGGTGTIGTAVLTELIGHGHRVLALARSTDSIQSVEAAGRSLRPAGWGGTIRWRDQSGVRRDYGSPDALARGIA